MPRGATSVEEIVQLDIFADATFTNEALVSSYVEPGFPAESVFNATDTTAYVTFRVDPARDGITAFSVDVAPFE